ncbi:hypothetical protein NE857_30980 [Nocardiopsis exhalans]|uniref:Uncharacterized protein n=1 Tax=Nocardiopsis exhalans TaxID=163604 RepID=A0ABY5D6I2_9ACTN|nr:hypothetical protein [Nocardiopsis exhalans]USY19612.1 hypothetical protein NE857_30980 [Nocardiopsis exhalans]
MRSEIENVYRVFARYPRPARVEGCRHCVTENDHRDLLGAPLRELDAERLRRFSHKALNTWGDVDDLRHFLPRLLELALRGEGDLHGLFAKLHQGGWTGWPEDERDALRTCLSVWWEDGLTGTERPDAPLDTLAETGDDLAPYLDSWWGRDTPQALWALADLVSEVAHTMPRARDDRVVTWLATTRGWLENAFFEMSEAGQTELAEALSESRQLLDLVTLDEPVPREPEISPEPGADEPPGPGSASSEATGPEATGPPGPAETTG